MNVWQYAWVTALSAGIFIFGLAGCINDRKRNHYFIVPEPHHAMCATFGFIGLAILSTLLIGALTGGTK